MTLPDQKGLSLKQDLSRFVDDPFVASVLTGLADICLILSLDGAVMAASARMGTTLGPIVSGWKGAQIKMLLDQTSIDKLQRRIEQLRQDVPGKTPRWAELSHPAGSGEAIPVRYALYLLPDREHLLMLGDDQRPTLEMQQLLLNAQIALERDHEAQREIDTRYRLLMDFTSDAIVLISAASGQVVDLNHDAAAILGRARSDAIGKPLSDFLLGQTRETLVTALDPANAVAGAVLQAEAKSSQRKLQMTGKMFRASGEQLAILRLSDPDGGSIGDQRLSANLRQLFHQGSDAIVFCDRDGTILAASETFLNLTDAASAATVRGRSLSDFLARGAVDLRVLLDNARRAGQLRMYATKLNTDFGAHVAVEISATWLEDQFDPVLALVLRNASSSAAQRPEMNGGNDGNMQGVIELVGSSTLKDIVSETTDVIEKICIETALELTRNNRVAAAEILGLSRQSLYVKLRKYGLLSKDEG